MRGAAQHGVVADDQPSSLPSGGCSPLNTTTLAGRTRALEELQVMNTMHRSQYLDARTDSTEHPSLASDPIPEFFNEKMERRWVLKFAEGSVPRCLVGHPVPSLLPPMSTR